MKLKQSIYNYIYNDLGENQVVFYNAFTGALAVVKAEQYQQFKDYFENGKEFRSIRGIELQSDFNYNDGGYL